MEQIRRFPMGSAWLRERSKPTLVLFTPSYPLSELFVKLRFSMLSFVVPKDLLCLKE